MLVASIVTKKVSFFLLPYLVTVDLVVEEKSKIGIQLKIIMGVVQLIFYNIAFAQIALQLEIDISATCFSALIGIDSSEETDQPVLKSSFRNLTRCFPFTVKSGSGQAELS